MVDRADTGPTLPPWTENEMTGLVRAKDWSATPLGPMDAWSPSLRLALDIVLSSGFPMALRWGPDFILLYNDGYKPILGEKHPQALGMAARGLKVAVVTIDPARRLANALGLEQLENEPRLVTPDRLHGLELGLP